MRKTIFLVSFFLVTCSFLNAQLTKISRATERMEKFPGYLTFYWEAKTGKIWLEIDKLGTEFLYVNSLPAGLGSNDVGLDRNQLGESRVVKFQRIGPKVLLIQQTILSVHSAIILTSARPWKMRSPSP